MGFHTVKNSVCKFLESQGTDRKNGREIGILKVFTEKDRFLVLFEILEIF